MINGLIPNKYENIDSPSNEDFILTNKKMRMIKSEMINYKNKSLKNFDNYVFKTDLDDFIDFMKNRLLFLKNLDSCFAIGLSNGVISLLIFKYKKDIIVIEVEL